MQNNVGGMDTFLRVVVGVGLLTLVFMGPKTLWGLIGIVPLATAAMSWCPLYTVFGINTCKTQGQH
jgi:hypothetical protein